MDGPGQQDRKALAAERDLWTTNQGTVQRGNHLSQHLNEPLQSITELFLHIMGRSTHLKCTSSRPKKTMLETTGVKSATRTSLTAALLTWKWKVCPIIRSVLHSFWYPQNADQRVLLLSCRGWNGLTKYWYSIGFQKEVKKVVWWI